MTKRKHLSPVLSCLWVLSTLVFTAYSINQQLEMLSNRLAEEAQVMLQRVSQRADQHDAHLTNLSALANAGELPPLDLMAKVAQTIQRFYPRITAIDLISLDAKQPSWITSTRRIDKMTPELAAKIQQSALASTGSLDIIPVKGNKSKYLLIKSSPNTDAARYGLALTIDASKLIDVDTEFKTHSSIFLSNPAGENILTITATLPSTSFRWRPSPLIFERVLGSKSQPLVLRIEQRPTVGDLVPLPSILWFSAFLAVVLFGTNSFTKQRTATREAQSRAKLGKHEARIAHASRINSLGEMASGIAHELNQPLTAILSQSQACLRILQGSSQNTEGLQRALKANVQQSKRAGQILKRLRNWTKRETLTSEVINLNDVTRGIGDLMQSDLRERRINFTISFSKEALMSNCDPVQIEQVIFNLVRNAADAIDEKGDDIRQIKVKTENTQELALIKITDSGTGILEDVMPRLFKPFYSTKEDGMGLGLSLSESIILRFGGSIGLTNHPDGGACATILIPLAKPLMTKGKNALPLS